MHTLELGKKRKYFFASCLEELKPKAYLQMLRLVLLEKNGLISKDEFMTRLTMVLLDVKMTIRYFFMNAEKKQFIHDNIKLLSRELDSFFTVEIQDGIEKKVLRLDTIKNLLPVYKGLVGPADALTDLTFFEYKEAYNCFSEYEATHDKDKLDQLIAILYRPTKKFLFIRKYFSGYNGISRIALTPKSNPVQFDRKVREISRWPEHVKVGIYIWFSSCREYMTSGSPVIDGNEIHLSVLYTGGGEGPTGIGLSGVLFTLAESMVFGNLGETSNANLYDVLARLYQLKVDYDYQTSKTKK